MFVLAILSHGVTGGMYLYLYLKNILTVSIGFICSDSGYCSYADAFSYFNSKNCSILHEKPKIFIVQACQGSNTDYGYEPQMPNTVNVQSSQQTTEGDNEQTYSKDGPVFSKICEPLGLNTNPEIKVIYEIPNSDFPNLVPSTLDRLEIYSSVDGKTTQLKTYN